jgi:hypothetical protein
MQSRRNRDAQNSAQELLQKSQCYVLITCGEPSQNGEMPVEMTYGGDPVLAAYLVESASTMIDSEV